MNKTKFKNALTLALFCLLIFAFCFMLIFLPKQETSKTERRKLAKFPEAKTEEVLSGEYFSDIETYLLDHFPGREMFRRINSSVRTGIFFQSDVNDIRVEDGSIFKYDGDLDRSQAEYTSNLINKVIKKYFSDNNGASIYYSVIPDKNYYLDTDPLRPKFDYDELLAIMAEKVEGAEYIDIFGSLELSDYYRTDSHWMQPEILPVVQTLSEAMGSSEYLTKEEDYVISSPLYPFHGVYHGQAAMNVKPDEITYLTSADTDSAKVTGFDESCGNTVYNLERFEGMDGYDIFLSGAQSYVIIECPNARSDKELVIFRDSYGSSIAPLFTGAYSKITLVDLRYFPSDFLGNYLTFAENSDVLFLYSSTIINTGKIMS